MGLWRREQRGNNGGLEQRIFQRPNHIQQRTNCAAEQQEAKKDEEETKTMGHCVIL
jgi:hypothetical protein